MNVSFKQGLQENLNKSTTQKIAGAFYLTTDTNRLYYCDGTSFKDLNQYIHSVANQTALANVTNAIDGDYYFVEQGSMLCRYDSSKATGYKWVQINPNTTLDVEESDLSVTTTNNVSTVALSVKDTASNEVLQSLSLAGGSNVHLTSDGTTITISADNDTTNTTYDLSTATNAQKGQINLVGTNSTTDTVYIQGDGDTISVTSDANGNITIAGASGIDSVTNTFSAQGAFTTAIGLTNDNNVTSTAITPTITYGVGQANKLNATFNADANVNSGAPTAALSIYTKDEIDDLLEDAMRAFNAMEFKGVLSTAPAATAALISNETVGATYLMGTDITTPVAAKAGDLVVAEGTDGNVTWTVIQSGNDQIVVATANSTNNSLTLSDSVSESTVGSVNFVSGNDIAVSSSADGGALTVTVSHGALANMSGSAVSYPADASAASQGAGGELIIPTITGISKDAYGHVTGVTTNKYKVVDTHAVLTDIGYSSSVTSNVAVFTGSIALDDDVQKTFSQQISTSSLTITNVGPNDDPNDAVSGSNTAGIKIDLTWGTF